MSVKVSKIFCGIVDTLAVVFIWLMCLWGVLRWCLPLLNSYGYRVLISSSSSDIQYLAVYLLPFMAINVVTLFFVVFLLIKLSKVIYKKSFAICDKYKEKKAEFASKDKK